MASCFAALLLSTDLTGVDSIPAAPSTSFLWFCSVVVAPSCILGVFQVYLYMIQHFCDVKLDLFFNLVRKDFFNDFVKISTSDVFLFFVFCLFFCVSVGYLLKFSLPSQFASVKVISFSLSNSTFGSGLKCNHKLLLCVSVPLF